MKIAVISDLHFADNCPLPDRRGELAHILLLRTVHRLNRMIKPDATVILGDLLDTPDSADASDKLKQLRDIIGLLKSPVIVLPGNHDPSPENFFQILPSPLPWIDIGNTRLLPFVDREEPGYNASRNAHDWERFRQARAGFSGPLVALQHVSLFPPGLHECPYNYTNADEIIARMRENGVCLSLSGHYHAGFDIEHDGIRFITVPALCVEPFPFLEINLTGNQIEVVRHQLQLPRQLGLVDWHSHTEFAYCGENMAISLSPIYAEAFGLRSLALTEHSGHLYFGANDYYSNHCFEEGIGSSLASSARMIEYLRLASEAAAKHPNLVVGLEVDTDARGNPVLRKEDARQTKLLIGGIHYVPELAKPMPDMARACDEYLVIQKRLIESGIHILAHPFRVFRRSGQSAPQLLFAPTIKMLKEHNVAAEINFHTNTSDPVFFRSCVEAGVKLALGSDAHNLYEIGELAPHLQLLKEIGCEGDLSSVLKTRQ